MNTGELAIYLAVCIQNARTALNDERRAPLTFEEHEDPDKLAKRRAIVTEIERDLDTLRNARHALPQICHRWERWGQG